MQGNHLDVGTGLVPFWKIGTFLTWQDPLRVMRSRQRQSVQVPTSPLRSCVTSDQSLSLSELKAQVRDDLFLCRFPRVIGKTS